MIETINIWKRSHDGHYSVCILVKDQSVMTSLDTFKRFKETRKTLSEIMLVIMKYQERYDF